MKEGILFTKHFNNFNIITYRLAFIEIVLDDEIRAILLIFSMLDI